MFLIACGACQHNDYIRHNRQSFLSPMTHSEIAFGCEITFGCYKITAQTITLLPPGTHYALCLCVPDILYQTHVWHQTS